MSTKPLTKDYQKGFTDCKVIARTVIDFIIQDQDPTEPGYYERMTILHRVAARIQQLTIPTHTR